MPVATSTAIAEAKPTMAARPSHTSGPPPPLPCFALCSHLMDSDLLAALHETRLLLELMRSADAAFDTMLLRTQSKYTGQPTFSSHAHAHRS